MKKIFYIRPNQLEIAKIVEELILNLPSEIEINFVSIEIRDSVIDGEFPYLDILVGCKKSQRIELVEHLIKKLLEAEEWSGGEFKAFSLRIRHGVGKS